MQEYAWLLSRGYAPVAALKLVGDHHGLQKRQRDAVRRCTCDDAAKTRRQKKAHQLTTIAGQHLAIDGFNCLITVECALMGGLVLVGRDRAHRDLASIHGSYRRVKKTSDAIAALGSVLADSDVIGVHWILDRPVSNSGRLAAALRKAAAEFAWPWTVELAEKADPVLAQWPGPVATSDAGILDCCRGWVDLPGAVIARGAPAWLLDLSEAHPESGGS